MFTLDSRKLRLSAGAVAVVLSAYLLVNLSLTALAHHFESTGEVYPYKSEDWLRYLLPAFFEVDSRPGLVITGPSTARENLQVEVFTEELPGYRVFQGGLSLGTLEDVLASLQYTEQVYGDSALPTVLVLGISPRFLAEIPAQRPFSLGINQYSSYFGLRSEQGEFRLVAKSRWEGARSWLRFRTQKQTPRYRAAVLATVGSLIPQWLDAALQSPDLARFALRAGFSPEGGAIRVFRVGPRAYIANLVSPYKYRRKPWRTTAVLEGWLDASESFWRKVHTWDPAQDAQQTVARLGRLVQFVQDRDIQLFVVNMPEREVSRVRYDPVHYERYEAMFSGALEGWPLLDLREELEDREFYDAEHATAEGGDRMTRMVLSFMRENGFVE